MTSKATTVSLTRLMLGCSFLFFSIEAAFCQNISTSNLSWEIDEATDTQTNTSTTYHAVFRTLGSQSVEWVQKKGGLTTTYSITSVEGMWTNVSEVGSIIYNLYRNGKQVKMTIERKLSGTIILMDFSQPGNSPSIQRFRVKSVVSN